MEQRVVFTHKPKLLENYKDLCAIEPEEYVGFIYLWYCKPEQKFYLGSHKGKSYDDYRGSGTHFRSVFEFYGMPQFDRVIIEFVTDVDKLKVREQHWLTTFNAAKSQYFYNMRNVLKVVK